QAMAPFRRLQNEIGIRRRRPGPHRHILFSSGIDTGLETAPVFSLQQANDSIVLQLLADRPHQDGAHQMPPNRCKIGMKRESLAMNLFEPNRALSPLGPCPKASTSVTILTCL